MFNSLLKKIFGTKHDRDMKALQPLVTAINDLEKQMQALSDDQLKAKTSEFQNRLKQGETLDDILPEAFAVCREASVRVLNMRHYDVQLIGGIVLHRGTAAEMKTGEGKTLVATLPVYLNALSGKGVHVVTVNDYLATRDSEWMGQLYNWLGLSVGVIIHDLSDEERQVAYNSDITYGTNNEFGFDYLRDNMKFRLEDYVQRELNFAIIDECDSILIDEARTPLIISGPSEESTEQYYNVNKIIPKLKLDVHFTMEEKSKTVSLTEEGNEAVEKLLNVKNIFEPKNIQLLHHIYQGLKAHHLFSKDVDYMVQNNEIVIVDEFTGRLMEGRRWSDGLHQAIEAKENVRVKSENQTLASITFQNYFRMYNRISGMTGTAETEAVEFKKIYKLDVIVIPTHRPIQRQDKNDIILKTESAKYKKIGEDIQSRAKKGQPILVGTVSIEKSELISRILGKMNIKHNILNAKYHEKEAEIISQAGRKGSVTIATNMAGRGTDIVLGGNPEALTQRKFKPEDPAYEKHLEETKEICEKEKQEVITSGGLYIIGTERHESRRIDNQLRGRSGRQGDPGESRFYLSLEDNLMRIFNGERLKKIMGTLNIPDDEPIEARMVSRAIEGSQRKVEGHNFDIRKHLLDYDDVMNKQRMSIYTIRRDILKGEKLERMFLDILEDLTSRDLDLFANEQEKKENWDLEGLRKALINQFAVDIDFGNLHELSIDTLNEKVGMGIKQSYENQKQHLGEHFSEIQKMLFLQILDHRWKEHLQSIDHLKEGINLRAYAQKDPLIEYKKEAFQMYTSVLDSIHSEVVEKFLKIRLVDQDASFERQQGPQRLEYHGTEEETSQMGQFFPPPQEEMQYSGAESGGPSGPKMNRAERRRLARQKNKRG